MSESRSPRRSRGSSSCSPTRPGPRVDPEPAFGPAAAGGQPVGPGAETRLLVNVAGRPSKGVGRCLEWDPPHRLVLASSLDIGISSTTSFELTPTESGTAVSPRVDYTLTSGGLGRLVGGLSATHWPVAICARRWQTSRHRSSAAASVERGIASLEILNQR